MNKSPKKLLMTMSFIFPFLAMALEEISSPSEIFNALCKASMTSPQKCRQFTLYSKKHKLYFVFFAAYTGNETGKSYNPADFDQVFIFRDRLEMPSLSFYLDPNSVRTAQILDRGFHPDIAEDKINNLSEISVSPQAVAAGYYLDKKFHRSSVFLFNGIRLSLVNGKIKEAKPAFSDITQPRRLSMPFDLSEISAEGKNLSQEKLSAKSVKKNRRRIFIPDIEGQFLLYQGHGRWYLPHSFRGWESRDQLQIHE